MKIERQGKTVIETNETKIIRASVMSGKTADSDHHEPPRNEFRAHKIPIERRGEVVMHLTLAEHRAFHFLRGRLFDSPWELDTAHAIEERMDSAQKEEYEAIMKDSQKVQWIEEEIIRRQRKYIGEC